jgi:hypothetical protein
MGYRSELMPKRTGRRGRPEKTVKYHIPGVGPVGVYEFRTWLRNQKNALKRAQKIKLLQLKQQGKIQQAQQEAPTPQQEQQMYAEARGSEMQPDQIQTLQQAQAEQYSYQQELPQRGTPVNNYEKQLRDLQMQQAMAQSGQYPGQQAPSQPKDNNILSAPNIFSVEGNKLSENMNPLKAPNVARGELRQQNQIRKVEVGPGQSPIANVEGLNNDSYTDIDSRSGRPILKRRITEKWSSGQSL